MHVRNLFTRCNTQLTDMQAKNHKFKQGFKKRNTKQNTLTLQQARYNMMVQEWMEH